MHTGNELAQGRTAKAYTAKQRSAEALKLRLMRHSYDTIASTLGYSNRGAAYKAVQRELDAIPREDAKALRAQELETLDLVQRSIGTALARGQLGAIDRMLKIMDTRAKLTGLYDEQHDTGVDEVKGVLAAWLGAVIAAEDEQDEQDAIDAADDEWLATGGGVHPPALDDDGAET